MSDAINLGVNLLVGVLGGFAWLLVAKIAWEESYEWLRRIAIGGIIGFVYFLMSVFALGGGESALLILTTSYLGVDWFTAFELKSGGA